MNLTSDLYFSLPQVVRGSRGESFDDTLFLGIRGGVAGRFYLQNRDKKPIFSPCIKLYFLTNEDNLQMESKLHSLYWETRRWYQSPQPIEGLLRVGVWTTHPSVLWAKYSTCVPGKLDLFIVLVRVTVEPSFGKCSICSSSQKSSVIICLLPRLMEYIIKLSSQMFYRETFLKPDA